MIVVVMGVSGAGKTTIGRALAASLGWQFADADDFHSPANIARMQAGIPLNDEDRAPWLSALSDAVAEWDRAGRNVVLACSALRQAYRDTISRHAKSLRWVVLAGSFELISKRLEQRTGHFMSPKLLASQFETLELPMDALVVNIDGSVEEIVVSAHRGLGLR